MINVLTKVLPRFKYHLGTPNGVSVDKNGGKNESLGGTWQGNIFQV